MRCYFELHQESVVRFAELFQNGNTVTSTTGKKGTKGRTTTQTFDDEKQAMAAFSKLEQKKIKEGFQLQTFPFPFFGAGYGHYYEWAEVEVRFVLPPSPAQTEQIIRLAPAPIKPGKNDFRGRMLLAGSNQFVNMYIQEAYDDPTAWDKMNEKAHDAGDNFDPHDEDSALFYASEPALDAFECDIERWLLEIHGVCPIEFAYRQEDWEAGGTELSAWHRISLDAIPQLIQQWHQDPATWKQTPKEKDLFQYSVSGIFNFGEVDYATVPDSLIDYLFPDVKIERLFLQPDLTDALAYLQKNRNRANVQNKVETILRQFLKEGNHAKVVQLTEAMLVKLTSDYSFMLANVGRMVYAAMKEDNRKLIDQLVQKLSHRTTGPTSLSGDCASCDYLNNIGAFAFSLHHHDTYAEAQRLYEIALDIETPEPCKSRLEIYCNVLWVLQYDNTGLPVNATLNEKILAKCLPYGPQNPAIYFNAACVYVEMNQFEKAVECVSLAIRHKYSGIRMMKDQILTEKMFAGFRKYAPLIEVLDL
jgi:predicted DNA-binding WGR domain protein/tetratricopeptide (TPR) repeat protein